MQYAGIVILFFLLGVVIGSVIIGITAGLKRTKPSGYLRMVQDEPDEPPYLFLDLDVEPQKLYAENRVVFVVVPPGKEGEYADR